MRVVARNPSFEAINLDQRLMEFSRSRSERDATPDIELFAGAPAAPDK
jgi:hypothetical protein